MAAEGLEATAQGVASDAKLFQAYRAELAAQEIEGADAVGSALKSDAYHRSASFVTDTMAADGKVFSLANRTGTVNLTQVLRGNERRLGALRVDRRWVGEPDPSNVRGGWGHHRGSHRALKAQEAAMLVGPIPSSFIMEKTSLSLPELRWAFDNGVIGAQIVVDVAQSMVDGGNTSNVVTRLASVTHAELPEVREIISNVAVDDEEADASRRKWVWLVLSWLYEHHREDANVFEKIDGLYADFGYPQEMTAFGPYAPAYQAKGDPTEQRQQVVGEWGRYLSRGEESFGRS